MREHCCFLKEIEDGQRIRRALINCFERASIPGLTEREKEKILSFVVVGAGPSGAYLVSLAGMNFNSSVSTNNLKCKHIIQIY